MLNILFCINEMDKIIDNFKGIKRVQFWNKGQEYEIINNIRRWETFCVAMSETINSGFTHVIFLLRVTLWVIN